MKIDYWQNFVEGQFYHIYNRTNGGIPMFVKESDFDFFLSKWELYISPYFELMAYCLIGNHFHFTAKVKDIDNTILNRIKDEATKDAIKYLEKSISYDNFLDSQFKRMFHSYSMSFNKANNRTGSLFQPKYKKVELKSQKRIVESICYVHHNPIHHNYTPFYNVWQHSSYNIYLAEKEETIIAKELTTKLITEFSKSAYLNNDMTFVALFEKLHIDYNTFWLRDEKWKELNH